MHHLLLSAIALAAADSVRTQALQEVVHCSRIIGTTANAPVAAVVAEREWWEFHINDTFRGDGGCRRTLAI